MRSVQACVWLADNPFMKKPLGERFRDALPHLGAVGLSLTAYFALLVPLAVLDTSPRPLGLIVYVVLMASPVVGAVVVLKLQGRPNDLRSVVVKPYVRAFLVAAVAMLVLALEGVIPFFNENGVGVVIVAAAFLTLIVVPFVIPTLRFLMWLVSPPTPR